MLPEADVTVTSPPSAPAAPLPPLPPGPVVEPETPPPPSPPSPPLPPSTLSTPFNVMAPAADFRVMTPPLVPTEAACTPPGCPLAAPAKMPAAPAPFFALDPPVACNELSIVIVPELATLIEMLPDLPPFPALPPN